MKRKLLVFAVIIMSMSLMAGCSGADGAQIPDASEDVGKIPTTIPATEVEATQVSTEVPVMVVTETPAPVLSFDAAIFREESAGIELSYPSGWTVSPREVIGERGAQQALLSPGSTLEQVADGGTRIIFVTYQWDPKNDLDAYITQRKLAWEASGFKTLGEEEFMLDDGRRVVIFTMETSEGNQVLFALLNAGEDYLQVSGDGDRNLAMEIIRTIKILD